MDRETLLSRLRGREWTDFEVKEAAFAVPRSAYATVSAFANTAGGWLVFGVAERDGRYEIVGVTDPDTVQNDFLGACRSGEKFSHPIDVRASGFDIDGKGVLAFHIPAAGRFERPIRVRLEKSWQSYVRLGGGDYQCNPHEEARFLRDADAEAYDATVLPERGFADLDAHSVAWLRAMAQPRVKSRKSGRNRPESLAGIVQKVWPVGQLVSDRATAGKDLLEAPSNPRERGVSGFPDQPAGAGLGVSGSM